MANYRNRLSTTDLWNGLPNHVGSDRHCSLIDKLAACRSAVDEELLQLHEGGHTITEIASAMGLTQYDTQERLRRIFRRANKG